MLVTDENAYLANLRQFFKVCPHEIFEVVIRKDQGWKLSCGPSGAQDFRTPFLHHKHIEPQIDDTRADSTTRPPIFRLVVLDCNGPGRRSPSCLKSDDEVDHEAQSRRSHVKAILDGLGIPPLREKDAINFFSHPPPFGKASHSSDLRHGSHVYRISSGTFDLVWSCSPSGNVTAMITHSERQAGSITENLLRELFSHRELMGHPMALALLAHRSIAPKIEEWLRVHVSRVCRTVAQSGLHYDLNVGNAEPMDEARLGDLSRHVTGVGYNLVSNKHCWEGLQALAEFIISESKHLARPSESTAPPDGAIEDTEWDTSRTYLEQDAQNCARSSTQMIKEADSWQQKAQIQIQGIFNLIAQRDNNQNLKIADASRMIAEQTKKDSTSMKVIAIMTVCFLPGTFFAALFSIPIFDWRADTSNSESVVSNRIWVYLVFTVPITLVVILAFAIFEHCMERKSRNRAKKELEDVLPV